VRSSRGMTDPLRNEAQEMPKLKLVSAVVEILRDTVPATVGELADHDKSLFDMGLDSLDHSAVLLALEERYGIKIPDEDVESLSSVNQIATYLMGRISD
jgi:acyl carrier protein